MNLFQKLGRRLGISAGRARASSRPVVGKLRVRSLEDRTLMSAFAVVSTTANSGPGSLRAAIAQVNANPSTSQLEIDYNLPRTASGYNAATGQYTIQLTKPLPALTHPVFINGASEPGYAGTPPVILKGSATAPNGLIFNGTSGKYGSFAATVDGMKFTQFSGYAIQVLDTLSATAMQARLTNNQISGGTGADGILVRAGTTSTAVTVRQNTISLGQGGDGLVLYTGGNSTALTAASNTVTCGAGGDGIVVHEAGHAADTLGITGNQVTCSAGGDPVAVLGKDGSNAIQFSNNILTTTGGGDALTAAATSTVTLWTITNNAFHTNGQGIGLALTGNAALQALVQGNNFGTNLVGVQVTGNGTTAGAVDLGGGSLGSTGGNDFTSFTTANDNSFAIGLFGVSPGYTLYAKNNLFSVNPTQVIADGVHHPGAGGSGQILI